MDDTKDTIINGIDYSEKIAKAIRFFWNRKQKQLSESGDTSNRGAVVGGKQMDGFVELLKEVASNAGIPAEFIKSGSLLLMTTLPSAHIYLSGTSI